MAETHDPIVIVGGGAGGAELSVRLAKAGQSDVLLIDQSQTHVWKPRLHEVAGGARRNEIKAYDYKQLAQDWGFTFEQGELTDLDHSARRLTLAAPNASNDGDSAGERTINYQILVLAVGGVTPDLGVEGVLEHAAMLDRAPDAEALYQRFSHGLEAQAQAASATPLRIVIVGSGLTGVELAAHMANDHVDSGASSKAANRAIEITVLEADDTFMPSMDDDVRETVRERLEASGIAMRTGQQVTRVSADSVSVKDGDTLPADITVWTAGRVGPPLAAHIEGLETNDKRQWLVRDTLQTTVSDHIFAFGDCSYIASDPAPPTAQAATEQAEYLAHQIPVFLDGGTLKTFQFKDKGTLLSFGEKGSVMKVRGFFGFDVKVNGRLSKAAYRGLERQHQSILLGAPRTGAAMAHEFFDESSEPALKVH